MFEGFETSISCSVLAHMKVSKKGIFISTDYWKMIIVSPDSNSEHQMARKPKKQKQSWILKALVHLMVCFHYSDCLDLFSGPDLLPFYDAFGNTILMSLANVLHSCTQLEKISDQSTLLKTPMFFFLF